MEAFVAIRPELSGHARGDASITFDTWLGDDLVAAHPWLVATTPVKNDLVVLAGASGFSIVRARTKTSPFFRHYNPGRRLPVFWLIKVVGAAGRDDIGVAKDGSTVVSRRVLDVLLRHKVARAIFSQYRAEETGTVPRK